MTNPTSYSYQQFPAYSGVTINISNPTVNAGYPGCTPQVSVQQDAQAAGITPVVSAPVAPAALQQAPQNVEPPKEQNQNQIQSYPPQYYLNNYNIQNGQKSIPEGNINPVPNTAPKAFSQDEMTADSDMSSSTEIINELDSRVNEQKELEKNGKQKKVVALTNEYIMSLENYLNNPNTEIRLMAAKEILTRLDEDKERHNDAALNALLNKMLQDPEKMVRIAALSAFSSQLASGNDFTVELLTKLQQDPNADKEDVLEAANILLKMSASTEVKYVPVENKKAEE